MLETAARVSEQLSNTRKEVEALLARKKAISEMVDELRTKINHIISKIELLDKVQKVLQIVSREALKESTEEIQSTVELGLSEIFGEKLKFTLEISEFGDTIKITPLLQNREIVSSFGGGVIDVVSTVCRVVFLYLSPLPKVLILDEVGKWLSSEYQAAFGRFLKRLSDELGIQIILVSHREGVNQYADKYIKL